MKLKSGLALFLLLVFSTAAYAQESQESAAESADKLKMQLLEVQGQEEALRARVQDLNEALKPENIERSLAGIGSTRPEELRESRRGVLSSLAELEQSWEVGSPAAKYLLFRPGRITRRARVHSRGSFLLCPVDRCKS